MMRHVVIAVFCTFHMIAIGIYAVPNADTTAVSAALRSVGSLVRPYVEATSQWQQWNLFAPEPTRRIVTYRVDAEQDAAWREVARLDAASYPSWRRDRRLKLLGRMLDPAERSYREAFSLRFLQSVCDTSSLREGTPVRLVRLLSVLPRPQRGDSLDGLTRWAPMPEPSLGAMTVCGGTR